MRTGSEISATTSSSAPCTAMPANRKGNRTTHTIGYKIIAITASGQQRRKRIHHSKNLIMISPALSGQSPPLIKDTQFAGYGFRPVLWLGRLIMKPYIQEIWRQEKRRVGQWNRQ